MKVIQNVPLSLYQRIFNELKAKVIINGRQGKKTAIIFAYKNKGNSRELGFTAAAGSP